MCCTLGPAKLSDTIVYAYKMPDGRHVLGYQNKATSGFDDEGDSFYGTWPRRGALNPWGGKTQPPQSWNAMVLPIPAKGEMTAANAVDLTADKTVLRDYAELVKAHDHMKSRSRGFGDDLIGAAAVNSVQVFKTGSYEVVMARQPKLIPDVVKELHPEVSVSKDLMEVYARYYLGWNVAVCFWQGTLEPEPIMFTYEPKYPTHLFIPTLDAHDGGAPKSHASLDHTIVLGTTGTTGHGLRRQVSPVNRPYLASRVKGFEAHQTTLNGDYWFPLAYEDIESEWVQHAMVRLPAGVKPA